MCQKGGGDLWVHTQDAIAATLNLADLRPNLADILLAWALENAKGSFRITPKTASELRFHFVAGAGFEPATSGL